RVERLQQRRHRVRLCRREPGGRLVEQEKPGGTGQRQRDLELALLAVREVAHDLAFLVGEADRVEDLTRAGEEGRIASESAMQMELGSGQRLHGEETVLERGEAGEEVRDLVRPGQAERRAPVRRMMSDVLPEERDAAVRRPRLAADQAEERRLAGS